MKTQLLFTLDDALLVLPLVMQVLYFAEMETQLQFRWGFKGICRIFMFNGPIVFRNESVQYFDKFYSSRIFKTRFLFITRQKWHCVFEFLDFFLKGLEFGNPSLEDGNDLGRIVDAVLDTFLEEAGSECIEITRNIAQLLGDVALELLTVAGKMEAQVAEVDLFLAEDEVIVGGGGIGGHVGFDDPIFVQVKPVHAPSVITVLISV